MATQELEQHRELVEKLAGQLERARGFALRKRRHEADSSAWRATITKHTPESWPAARLALQARIAALDVH